MKRRLIIFSVIVLALMVPITSASAYNLLGYHWPKSVGKTYILKVKYNTTLPSAAKTAFDSAVSDWNSAQTKINIDLSISNTLSPNVLTTENVADQSLYGDTSWSYIGTEFISFTAMVNIGNSDVVNKTNTARSAAGHELGHALGLDHTYPPYLSIMNSSRDREVVYTPQNDDISGINALYAL